MDFVRTQHTGSLHHYHVVMYLLYLYSLSIIIINTRLNYSSVWINTSKLIFVSTNSSNI